MNTAKHFCFCGCVCVCHITLHETVRRNIYFVDRVTCFVISKFDIGSFYSMNCMSQSQSEHASLLRLHLTNMLYVWFCYVWNLIWSNFIDFLKNWTNEWFAHWIGAEVKFFISLVLIDKSQSQSQSQSASISPSPPPTPTITTRHTTHFIWKWSQTCSLKMNCQINWKCVYVGLC